MPVLALATVISSPAQTAKPIADNYLHLEVVSGSDQPLIKPGDPGTEGIWMGLEGGTAIKQNGVYHLFTAETMREPLFAHMRLGYARCTSIAVTRMMTLWPIFIR